MLYYSSSLNSGYQIKVNVWRPYSFQTRGTDQQTIHLCPLIHRFEATGKTVRFGLRITFINTTIHELIQSINKDRPLIKLFVKTTGSFKWTLIKGCTCMKVYNKSQKLHSIKKKITNMHIK